VISFSNISIVAHGIGPIPGTIEIKLFEFFGTALQNFRRFEIFDTRIFVDHETNVDTINLTRNAFIYASSPNQINDFFKLKIEGVADFWFMKNFDQISVDGTRIHFGNFDKITNWNNMFAPITEARETKIVSAQDPISVAVFSSACRETTSNFPTSEAASKMCGYIQKVSGFSAQQSLHSFSFASNFNILSKPLSVFSDSFDSSFSQCSS
jgi:hypothetical protein